MKKLLSIFLVTVFFVSCIAVSASAAENPTFSATEHTVSAGDTVTVSINTSELTYQDYGMYVSYNPEVLSMVSATAGNASNGNFGCHDSGGKIKAAVFGGNNVTISGTLFTLTFQVAEDAAPGSYPIDVEIISVRNEAQEYLDVTAVDGCIQIGGDENTEEDENTAATCTVTGLAEGEACSVCGSQHDGAETASGQDGAVFGSKKTAGQSGKETDGETGDITVYLVCALVAMVAVAAAIFGLKRKFDNTK